ARFQVILYNRYAEPLRLDGHTDLVPASAANRNQVAAVLNTVRAEGATNHQQALRRALEIRPDIIFFVSDADDLTLAQVLALTRQNRGRSVIHTIELSPTGRPRSERPLALLAHGNRGTYQAVNPRR